MIAIGFVLITVMNVLVFNHLAADKNGSQNIAQCENYNELFNRIIILDSVWFN